MSAPFPVSVVIDQNRDWYLTVKYENVGVPINLTGYTASFALMQASSSVISLTLASGSGITITPATGQLDLHATSTQTVIPAGPYVAELVITSATGVETALLKGQITVSPKVVS